MPRFSLSRVERIRSCDDFKVVYRRGRRITTKYFILFFSASEKDSLGRRLGITVTRAVGNAVLRNRVKRQVREAFRLNKETLPKGSLVVKARLAAANVNNAPLREDLERGFKKLAEIVGGDEG